MFQEHVKKYGKSNVSREEFVREKKCGKKTFPEWRIHYKKSLLRLSHLSYYWNPNGTTIYSKIDLINLFQVSQSYKISSIVFILAKNFTTGKRYESWLPSLTKKCYCFNNCCRFFFFISLITIFLIVFTVNEDFKTSTVIELNCRKEFTESK